jgi:hypothetical protein
MDRLELVKVVAPYITAIVAVMVAAFTAWLSHRNWIKQFKIQRSEAILKEQIRLLHEAPKTLNDAMRLAAEAVYALACSDAFARAKSDTAANMFMKDYGEYQAKLLNLLGELEITQISVRLYFGEEAADMIATYRNVLLKTSVSSADIADVSSIIEQMVKNTDPDSTDMHVVISQAMPAVMPRIAHAFAAATEARLAVVRIMARGVARNDA